MSALLPRRSARRRAARLTLALLALAAPAVALPSSAAALDKGLMDETLPRSDDPAQRAEFFGVARQAGVSVARTYLHWDGTTDFPFPHEIDSIRRMAEEGAAHGITTLFVGINGELGRRYADARQIDLEAYRRMVRRSVEALRGLPVRLVWSPVNEANFASQMPKRNGAETWRRMQNLAYAEVKALDPSALVVAGELAPYARNARNSTHPGQFWRQALGLTSDWKRRAGTSDAEYAVRADAVTLHSYDYLEDPRSTSRSTTRWTIRNLGTTRRLLARAAQTGRLPRVAAKRLYITEFAYLAEGKQRISEQRAATYLRRAWQIALRERVRTFIWFQVRDPPAIFPSGLRTRDGRDRPVLDVFRTLR